MKAVYLTAKYYAKPRNASQTFRVGYMNDDQNISWDESVNLTTKLKNSDLSESSIILNIVERTVIKNNFDSEKTFDDLFAYFYNSSKDEINNALRKVGIVVQENNDVDVQQDVSEEAKESAGSELAAEAEPAVAS